MCILYSNIFAYLSPLSCKNTENIVAQAAFNKTLDFIPKSEFIFFVFPNHYICQRTQIILE